MNVDTVKEGTQIFLLDDCGLVDSSAHLRHLFQVNALDGHVVLFFFFLGDEHSFGSINALVDLESQEVLDFKSLC